MFTLPTHWESLHKMVSDASGTERPNEHNNENQSLQFEIIVPGTFVGS